MKKMIMLASVLLLSINLNADAPKGAYVGLGLGSSQFYDGGFSDDEEDELYSISSSSRSNTDYSSGGYKLYGGYQFNKIVAVEASYTKYGKYSIDYSNLGTKYADVVLNPTSLAIAANLGYNFGEESEYRPFGIIGLAYCDAHESGSYRLYEDTQNGAIRFGFGFEYSPVTLDGVGFRVAYESDFYILDTENKSSVYYEDVYGQVTGMFYLSAQYKF